MKVNYIIAYKCSFKGQKKVYVTLQTNLDFQLEKIIECSVFNFFVWTSQLTDVVTEKGKSSGVSHEKRQRKKKRKMC